ncbi:LapA family protein [candidate division KSB1 bacterium]|nr:LapA family protein [candidate division KSB1 bacterium]
MWIVKWILGALLIILILGFAFQNQHQVAHVNVWNWTSPEMPLYLIVYFGFSLGILTWLFVSIFKILQLKVECRKLNKQNELLTDELNRLRNLSVEEAFETDMPEEATDE